MIRTRRASTALASLLALAAMGHAALEARHAQQRLSIDQFLAPGFPFELVSAKAADRIAWLAYERGRRNVFTAAPPSFTPVPLTRHLDDDGIDLTDLRISDDGSIVVFVRGHAPNRAGWVANPLSDPDGAERTIWAARTSGGDPWLVAEGGEPVLAPDGSAVLYVKDGQIYRAPVDPRVRRTPMDRGEVPFIRAWGDNGEPVWSPDGSKIAFVSERGDHTLIGVYDVASRTVSWVAPGVDHDTSPAWSPDGRRLAFIRRPGTPFGQQAQPGTGSIGNPPGPAASRQRRGGGDDDQPPESPIPGLTRAAFAGGYTTSFWVAEIPGSLQRADGSIPVPAREVWHSLPGDESWDRVARLLWARDHLVFQAEPGEWMRYYSVPVSGGSAAPIELTPGDGRVETAALSSDGAFLFYGTNAGDIDRRHVWKVPTGGGEAVQLTRGEEIENYPVPLASGTHVYPSLPADFPRAAHVEPQNVTLTAPDGVRFNNQLFLPRDIAPGERRPAVIFVHGGPSRQMLLGYHYMHFYHMAYAVNQWLASQGYVVLSVNYRRSIGYGRTFRTAPNTGGRGNAEYQDVLAAGRYLQTRSDVDPDRIGIWGLSYGGVLTAQALARNSDIFKVGVDLAGVHLWGSSIDPASLSFQSSAIGAIGTWKSPVLLLHGDDDRNVAFAQTTGLVQLLRAHGVDFELIVFPDDVHDSLIYRRWIYTFERASEFIGRHIGPARASTSTP